MTSLRNYKLDNLKALLIVLVVFGHLLEPYRNQSFFLFLYIIIYSFHMPLFIIITGYFHKDSRSLKKLIYIYFLYNSFYWLFDLTLGGEKFSSNTISSYLLIPNWIMWYLLSLILWTLISRLTKKIPLVSPLVVFLSIIIQFLPFNFYILSIGRTISFFPFFYIGQYLKENSNIREVKLSKAYIIPLLLFLLLFYINILEVITVSLLYRSHSLLTLYGSLNISHFVLLALIFINALAWSLFIYIVIPKVPTRWTYLGQTTMPIYLEHAAWVLIIQSVLDKYIVDKINTFTLLALLVLCTILITLMLSKISVYKYLEQRGILK
ncbi:acyltransferase family protein [Mollicutes bacterium LVI A0078]|nr:acyltransferase family protein [Mollicutes bacterium LVI A0075]WOO91884.1 acyltransferase family protein [Mollicutes bacterium LVI A0078]